METLSKPRTPFLPWERALELAQASRFVYRPPGLAEEKLRKWGYTKVNVVDKENLRFLVAATTKRLLVAFRGSNNWGNWFTNLAFLGHADTSLGPVHPGFADAFRVLESDLWAVIAQLDSDAGREIWITGHSLGGSLAVLAAAECPFKDRIQGIHTFGQPRTGYGEFRSRFDAEFEGRMLRFVYRDDPVPRMPCQDYAHVGRMVWFREGAQVEVASEGEARSRGGGDAPPEPFTVPEMLAAQAELALAMRQESRGPAPAAPWEGEEDAEDGNLMATRGAALGVDSHRTQRYIESIELQLASPAPASEPGGDEHRKPEASAAAPEPVRELVTPVVPAPAPEYHSPVSLVQLPDSRAGEGALTSSGSPQIWEQLPPLAVHVLWSRGPDRAGLCSEAAQTIFENLSHRGGLDPDVESGVGIPVYAGHHFEWTRRAIGRLAGKRRPESKLVVILLLDRAGRDDPAFRGLVDELLRDLRSQDFRPNVRIVPVLVDGAWRTSLPGEYCRIADELARESRGQALNRIKWQVAVETAHFLMETRKDHPARGARAASGVDKVRVFISYARADEGYTERLAQYLSQHPGERMSAFFDVRNAGGGDSLREQLRQVQSGAVTLTVRTDNYSLSPYCQDEILNAKQTGMPLVSLYVLNEGKGRSFPYEANSLTLSATLPLDGRGKAELAERCGWVCLKAWLHHLHFHFAANVIYRRRGIGLPPQFLSRPPELLDFVEGPLKGDGAGIVLYADPPLSARETGLLRRAYPRIRLATPTTLNRETLSRLPTPPLDGLRVALALSPSSDLAERFDAIPASASPGGTAGLLLHHLNGATEYLTLSLIRAGAELGFGGRLGEGSYTSLLAHLVAGHNRVRKSSAQLLHNYVAHHYPDGASQELEINRIRVDPAEGVDGLPERVRNALHVSMMRLWMARDQAKGEGRVRSCDARVILGGRSQPQLGAGRIRQLEYTGRFPGHAEESFRHLAEGKPVFVAGGFLGAAGQVALALCGELDKLPKEADWKARSEGHRVFCETYDAHRPAALSGLPATLDDLWSALADFGRGYFWGEGAAENKLWTNGLTVAENRALFVSSQYDQISALVIKGLTHIERERSSRPDAPLKVALYQGSIADALDVDAYAVLILGSSRLRGADAALDAKLNGLIQSTLEGRTRKFDQIIPVRSTVLSGEYILPYWIEDLKDMASAPGGEVEWLRSHIREGLESIVRRAAEHRIRSLAIVPLGANLGLDACDSVRLIVETILRAQVDGRMESLAICEIDPERYGRILEFLTGLGRDTPRLSVTELPSQSTRISLPSFFLQFQEKESQRRKRPAKVSQLARGPRSAGTVPLSEREIDWNQVATLFAGQHGSPPPFQEHERLGLWLAEHVFAPGLAEAAVSEGLALPWDVLVDVPCSAIPFEMSCFRTGNGSAPVRPALVRGIRRGLILGNQPYHAAPVARTCYRTLIIANPTGDLEGTEAEADRVQASLSAAFGNPNAVPRMDLKILRRKEVTRSSVLEEVASGRYDFIHYAGHGNFDPDRPEKSGLILSDGFLKAEDLQVSLSGISRSRRKTRGNPGAGNREDAPHPPVLVILNACLSSRMNQVNQISLAQVVLQTGVGGFLGNRWNVGDRAAHDFAVNIYTDLVSGVALGEAICRARDLLFEQKSPDWCNYAFYGSPEIRLC